MPRPKRQPQDLTPKKAADRKASNWDQLQHKPKGKPVAQSLTDYQDENSHVKLTDYLGKTIFITHIEPNSSKKFGDGYKIWFNMSLNGKEDLTAAIYGQYVVPQFKQIYDLSNDGKLITPDRPLKATVQEAGNTYRLV